MTLFLAGPQQQGQPYSLTVIVRECLSDEVTPLVLLEFPHWPLLFQNESAQDDGSGGQ